MPIPPVVLTISGFDPSSGAGVTADIKTIGAHGCYGIACITALTVQSTVAVRQVLPTPGILVRNTLRELAEDLPIAAVRIGMLGSGEVARAVADFLEEIRPAHTVLDPVLCSSSGAELLDGQGVEVLRSRLLRLSSVVTPNLGEAGRLAGFDVRTLEDMKRAALVLHELGARAVVVTGGHLEGQDVLDVLSTSEPGAAPEEVTYTEYRGLRIDSRATHGTGCAFASALACNLALGQPLEDAVPRAKHFVATAIERAYPLGHGHGPMNLLFGLQRTPGFS